MSSSSGSNKKKRMIHSNVTVKLGCYSCRKSTKRFVFFFSKNINLNLNLHKLQNPKITPTTTTTTTTSSSTSLFHTPSTSFSPSTSRSVRGFGSLAVEKDSDDPYLDFRRSMLEMILENEMYSKNDLKELLTCFLHLNSPYHHDIIVRAFTDIWNGLYSRCH